MHYCAALLLLPLTLALAPTPITPIPPQLPLTPETLSKLATISTLSIDDARVLIQDTFRALNCTLQPSPEEIEKLKRHKLIHERSVVQMGKQDPYGTLGVAKTATSREIKIAFHRLSLILHPDKNAEIEKEANAAYAGIYRLFFVSWFHEYFEKSGICHMI
jgi:hypothetical protein